jgi:hypothetical protein
MGFERVLSELRPHAVEVWLREMPYSPETKRHIKSMLYRLFELAMKRDWLEAQRNPMSLVRGKGPKQGSGEGGLNARTDADGPTKPR